MIKILLLSHNLNQAKKWILQQNLENPFILDEREVALQNPIKFQLGFLSLNYSKHMTETMRVHCLSYKSKRLLFVLMDMRHQTAVEIVPHNHSILLYDGSFSRRLAYNPNYVVDHTMDFNSKFSIDAAII